MTDSMIPLERAARALCDLSTGMDIADEMPDGVTPRWHAFLPQARAVLQAIREPSERMAKAGYYVAETGAVLPAFEAMIDAALEEG